MGDIRITLALPQDTHDLLSRLAHEMDVDQGKVIRWGIKTIIEVTPLTQDKECRSKLSPHAKYLFDNLSKTLS